MNRIVLGGAQLGLPYGILNGGETLSREEVACILDTAVDHGIDSIDTAIAYGQSESIIGETSQNRFNIISKLILEKTILCSHFCCDVILIIFRVKGIFQIAS